MSNTGTVKVELRIDDKGVVRGFRQIGDESNTAGRKGKKAFDEMDKGAGSFNSSAKATTQTLLKMGAGVAGVLGLAKAWNSLKSSGAEYLELASIQEASERKLQSVLKATGESAGYNLAQLKAMASGLQEVTQIGDETTLAAMAILATFREVRGEAFERATVAAMDMVEIFGGDLNSAILQIGKALNDPVSGMTALSRSGVTFSQTQKDTIKTLQESGNIMAAQSVILNELEHQFGGSAKDALDEFKGGLTQAQNALGDTKEEMGFVITKNQFFIELTHMATEEFIRWGEQTKSNRDGLMHLAKDGVMTVVEGLRIGIETLRFFHNGWLGIQLVGDAAVHGLAVALDELNPLMRSFMKPLDALFEGLVKIGAMDTNPFDSLASGLSTFRESSGDVTRQVLADIESTNQKYDTVSNTLQGYIDKIRKIPVAIEESQTSETKTNNQRLNQLDGLLAATEKLSEKELKALQEANQKKYAWEIATAKKMADDTWLIREKGMEEAIKRQDDMQTRMTQMEYDAAEKSKKNAKDTAQTWTDAFKGWASNMSSDLNDILWKSDSTFADIGRSFAKMVTQMIIQTQAVQPFMSWAGTGIKAAGSWLTSFFHTGGVVGVDQTPKAMVPAAMFDKAPRYHTGLMPDEFAAILKKKETVFTEGQTRALGSALSSPQGVNVKVEVINRSGSDVEVSETRSRFDGASHICSVVLDRVHRNRSYKNNMRQALGVA